MTINFVFLLHSEMDKTDEKVLSLLINSCQVQSQVIDNKAFYITHYYIIVIPLLKL